MCLQITTTGGKRELEPIYRQYTIVSVYVLLVQAHSSFIIYWGGAVLWQKRKFIVREKKLQNKNNFVIILSI